MLSLHSDARGMLAALAASGPHPDLAAELRLFGRLVGSWDLAVAVLEPDGSWFEQRGEWHFGWILEGRAVQDVWICPARGLRDASAARPQEYGTTIRLYRPADRLWRSVWVGPVYGRLRTFIVQEREDGMRLVGTDDDGQGIHWTFSAVRPDSFHWEYEVETTDGGWRTIQTITARRMTT